MAQEDESRPHESTGTTADEAPTVVGESAPASSDGTRGDDTGPIHTPSRQPAFGPATVGGGGGPARGWEDPPPPPTPATSAEVLDRPMDDTTVAERLNRPGMARSTRILLLVLGAVVFLAAGLLIGRATAPATGPGSVPNAVGVIESVDTPPGGSPVVTVRAADGTLTALQTTPGTVVATPAAGGNSALRVGSQVTIAGERDQRGETIATRVDLPAR
ncbi:hypothetical protein LQ327_11645 [Actinomycetospora endophytica]|uniref:DUF5666 domain-containing protein n=1 Tax=Actinomycetospora endophytica TaxID=2291215 RepID=A0ABS8P710_9PSEU|nr:hypothetical protein [Actinomycetospora endophytica]MCD2194028.1 hypothetical protein [Actinomycetospora endophytica]